MRDKRRSRKILVLRIAIIKEPHDGVVPHAVPRPTLVVVRGRRGGTASSPASLRRLTENQHKTLSTELCIPPGCRMAHGIDSVEKMKVIISGVGCLDDDDVVVDWRCF